jgi:hypothetical protein
VKQKISPKGVEIPPIELHLTYGLTLSLILGIHGAKIAFACVNAFGESLDWSERDQTLYWVSAVEGELWLWNLNDSIRYNALFRCAPKGGGVLLLGGEDAILTMSENDREATR